LISWEDETWLHKPGPCSTPDSSEQKQACLTPLVMRTTNFHISHDYQSNSFHVSKVHTENKAKSRSGGLILGVDVLRRFRL
jgi:hypothetical protein